MKKEGYYSSGQFAGMAHVTLRTIRYYDKQGILKPSFVNESGARFYTDEDFARLQQILLLKYLGFSLDDIREMIVDTKDLHYMQNSLNIQLNLVRDRIEQMQLVEKAILETSDAINKQHSIDWSRMLNLIHLTGMEESLKKQKREIAQKERVRAVRARQHEKKLAKIDRKALETESSGKLKISLCVNIILVVCVVAMFAMALTSDSPTIMNYQSKLLNRYASWEQELTEREKAVSEKEQELGIQVDTEQTDFTDSP